MSEIVDVRPPLNPPFDDGPSEAVDHPAHYQIKPQLVREALDVIEAWNLPFGLGSVIKYVLRAGKKGDELEDLKKARWYLDREITRRERAGT